MKRKETRGIAALATAAAALLFCASACDRARDTGEDPRATAPSSASARSAPPSGSSAALPSSNPLRGAWKGTYQAKPHSIEMTRDEGAIAAWAEDAGSEASGEGSIELEVSGDGRVTGTSRGPLGDLQASGAVDDGAIRVQLFPVRPSAENAFTGYMLLRASGDGLTGELRASTGDARTVRGAAVKLTRAP